jgi:esterase/lipase
MFLIVRGIEHIQGEKDKSIPVAGAQWIYDHLGKEKRIWLRRKGDIQRFSM